MFKIIKYLVLGFVLLSSHRGFAFISEILEVKKQLETSASVLSDVTGVLDSIERFQGIEDQYMKYEQELRDFKNQIDEYERLGLDVKDFTELKNQDPDSLKGQISFFKNYLKRVNKLLKSIKNITSSPESITASEQIETNKTLRALLEDSQTKELRRLRREIASQKILLERRKKEQEFIDRQYSYINRHSKSKGFGLFHPFQNKNNEKTNKRKKFLGLF